VTCRYECTVMHAVGNSRPNSGHILSYVQSCVCSKDHSRQAFTTSVIGVVKAVSNWSVREPPRTGFGYRLLTTTVVECQEACVISRHSRSESPCLTAVHMLSATPQTCTMSNPWRALKGDRISCLL